MIEEAFVELLTNKIELDDGYVPVIIRYKPIDRTPCITIQKASENQLNRIHLFEPYETTRYHLSNTLWIDVWADNEEQRHYLIREVYRVIYEAINNHYRHCKQYDNGTCATTGEPCSISVVPDPKEFKSQCLTPSENDYVSFFRRNNILKWTFKTIGELRLDELELNTPLLRTQIQLGFERMKYYDVGGHLADELEMDFNEDVD